MKIFRYLTALAAAALTFTACEKDAADLFATDPVPPVMDTHADVLLTENAQIENVTFTWKAARNMEGDVLYTLYATSESQQIQLTTTTNLYYTASKETLRMQLVEGLNAEPNSSFKVTLFVVAENGVQKVLSEPIVINVFAWGDYVPAVVEIPSAVADGLVLTEDATANIQLLTWEPARFEYGTSPRYKVEMQYGDGARVTLADGLADTQFSIAPSTLNAQLIALGCPKETESEVKLIVTSTLEGEGAPTLESAAVTVKVTPYTPSYPEFVMLCGDFGGHGWSPTSNLPILKGDANTGEYHGLVSYYGAEYGMKVIYTHPKSLETIWVGATSEDGVSYTLGANDNIAPEEGSYVVYVNLAKNVMTLGKIESIGLIGSATEKGWDGQTNFTYNAETGAMELKAVTLGEGAYKVRVNDNWGNPWEDPKAYNLGGKADDMTFGGADIASEPGVYDITLNLSTSDNYKLQFEKTGDVVIIDPLSKNYGLVGTINEWGGTPDIQMILAEGEEYVVAKGVEMPADNQFKIRVDSDWAENYGAAGETEPVAVTVGSKSTLIAGGKNMTIAAGSYDIYYFPKSKEFIAVTAGAELPKPTAAYAVIGKFNEWNTGTQVPMEAANNGYVVAKNLNLTGVTIPNDGFKIKENVDNWDNSWGSGTVLELGVATAVTHNGGNMGLAAEGAYDVYFNPTELKVIVVAAGADDPTGAPVATSEQIEVGLIGLGGDWNNDVKLTQQADGSYYAEKVAIKASDSFKVRKAGAWDDRFNWGLAAAGVVAEGTQVELICGGGSQNISVAADGDYNITFYPALDGTKVVYNSPAKIKVEKVQGTTPTPGAALVWDEAVWRKFEAELGTGETTAETIDFGNGLVFTKGSGKGVKFSSGRVQLSGSGDFGKCTMGLTVTGPGVLELDIQSGNSSTDRFIGVYIDQKEITYPEGTDGCLAPMGERKVHTIDCSSAVAGSVINFHSKNSGINVYAVKWTPGGASTPTPDPVALATPVVTLDPASVEAGQEKAVAVAWAAVENAASYDVVFNGAAAVNVATNAYTIDAATVKALTKGEYKVSVVAKPATDATAYLASAAGEATLTVTAPAAVPLVWDSPIFEQFYNTLGGDNVTTDVDLGNGLTFIAGGSKCKFGQNDGAYRIQLGGSGNTGKCTLQLPVTGPGTLEVDIQSSGDAARYLEVAVDGTAVTPAEGLEGPDKTAGRKAHTVDCSTAKAGSVINLYSKGSAINVFVVKWTPKQ